MKNSYYYLPALGSLGLLLGAIAFQYLGDLAPCKLCMYQRYPHVIAVVAGIGLLFIFSRLWAYIGASAAAVSGAIGIYHTGIERGWWEGPNTCTSQPTNQLSVDELLDSILAAPIVRCDEVAWSFMSLSMASWNAIISFALAAAWLYMVKVKRAS